MPDSLADSLDGLDAVMKMRQKRSMRAVQKAVKKSNLKTAKSMDVDNHFKFNAQSNSSVAIKGKEKPKGNEPPILHL